MKNQEYRRRMKYQDRKDDIPDCPSLESLELNESDHELPVTADPSLSGNSHQNQVETSAGLGYEDVAGRNEAGDRSNIFNCRDSDQYSAASFDDYLRAPLFNVDKLAPVLEGIGTTILEIIVQLFQMARFGVKYPTPFAICLVIVGLYFGILYLEISVAATLDFFVGVSWPPLHIFFRNTERFFNSIGSWFGEMDEIGQAMYCDMASTWCHRFRLMCDVQCSFTELALNRNR
ncbi:unnamed protein product [Bursaphelenchus xylophilus]|nr:unnamed protein product [Bursaphelenchus xylophilus]CAG9092471.1 unnamed protein product [Bursaphelenchus xylophilus]